MEKEDLIKRTKKQRNKKFDFIFYVRFPVLYAISFYQNTLSPDHSWVKHIYPFGFCRFNPTCSDYGFEAILKFGIIKGSWLSFKRVLRCNPFSRGGFDPVPPHKHDLKK